MAKIRSNFNPELSTRTKVYQYQEDCLAALGGRTAVRVASSAKGAKVNGLVTALSRPQSSPSEA